MALPTIRPFLHLPSPTDFANISQTSSYIRRMWESLQATRKGKIECVTAITLTASAASTVLTDIRISPQSVLIFDPLTANAAAELAAGTLYVLKADRGDGTATLTHANNVQTDRDFLVGILG